MYKKIKLLKEHMCQICIKTNIFQANRFCFNINGQKSEKKNLKDFGMGHLSNMMIFSSQPMGFKAPHQNSSLNIGNTLKILY